jgi:hypothetical protein
MAREEFEQSLEVAQLAVKLYELGKDNPIYKANKTKLGPEQFVVDTWKLIEKARDQVTISLKTGWSHEEAQAWVGEQLEASRVPFERLCNPERNKGDTESIKLPDVETGETIGVEWKMYRGEGGERAFDELFWAYWCATSIPAWHWWAVRMYGEKLLASWKRDGVPPEDFLALARFRREQNDRSLNLQKNSLNSNGS